LTRMKLRCVLLLGSTACATNLSVRVTPTLQTDGAIGLELGVGGAIGIGDDRVAALTGVEAGGQLGSEIAPRFAMIFRSDAVRWSPQLATRIGGRFGWTTTGSGAQFAELGLAAAVFGRLPPKSPTRVDLGGELRVMGIQTPEEDRFVRFGLGIVLERNRIHDVDLFGGKH
jgi:hypothetical protein